MKSWELYAALICAGIFLLSGSKRKRKKKKSSGKGVLIAAGIGALLAVAGGGGAAETVVKTVTAPHSVSLESFRACVIGRESAGNPHVWNKQGYPYWGLYQFGKPLWTGYGGPAGDWGNSSTPAAEQTTIFYNVMAHQGGCQNWYPSDGCAYPANGCG